MINASSGTISAEQLRKILDGVRCFVGGVGLVGSVQFACYVAHVPSCLPSPIAQLEEDVTDEEFEEIRQEVQIGSGMIDYQQFVKMMLALAPTAN